MQRRDFSKNILAGLVTSTVAPAIFTTKNCPKLQKPARLKIGSRVAIIAPASSVSEEKLQKTMVNLTSLGLNLRPADHLRGKNGYLSGTDEERLEDLHRAFANPEIDAIWCARGGFGCTRLLENIDFSLIKKNPKILIGYSDITALHVALPKKTGLVTFHGPVGASDFTDFTLNGIRRALFEPTPRFQISLPDAALPMPDSTFLPEILQKGIGRGKLIGGNLSLLSALAGTKWAPDFSKKIVFIEDIDEKPYRCDRMLTQCLDALNLRKAAGIALGVFKGCEKPEKDDSFTLREMLRDRLANLGIPVIYGLPFGHISDQCTLPIGIDAELDANQGVLTVLESGVF
jgi:muramoyltetrapeptide carboxypeptidase